MARIALDVMGGDKAPEETVAGAVDAAGRGVDVVLVGDGDAVGRLLEALEVDLPLVHSSQVIEMGEDPATAVRDKKDASVTVAARMVADGEAAGMVSAGSTGAALAAAALVIGRLPGIDRPGIAGIFPAGGGIVVIDVGANIECRPEHLAQFAVMGRALAETYLDKPNPRVGLLNIGEEAVKGRNLEKEAFGLLEAGPTNFVGNVEGHDLATGRADVFVTDGFTGNVLLKTTEGAAHFLSVLISETLMSDLNEEHRATEFLVPKLAEMKERIDPESYGGAHLVGTHGVVVISHGSSSRRAISNALLMASEGAERGLVERMAAGLSS